MKKAKEYAAEINAVKGTKEEFEVIKMVMNSLIDEIKELQKQRGSRDAVMEGILRELNQKWNAISRRTDELLVKDGFRDFLYRIMPELKEMKLRI